MRQLSSQEMRTFILNSVIVIICRSKAKQDAFPKSTMTQNVLEMGLILESVSEALPISNHSMLCGWPSHDRGPEMVARRESILLIK